MDKLFRSFYQLLISILLSVFLIIPIFSIVFGFNEIRRILVTIYFKLKNIPVTISEGADGAYGFSSRAVIRILCVFKSDYDFDNLKANFIQLVLQEKDSNREFKCKKLRSNFITEAGYSCWKIDEKFDPNNHFRKLPENPNMTEEELMEIIQELDQPLPQGRPQWEVIFIPRLPNNNECGVLLRIHHSYGDGLSIINSLGEKLSQEKVFPYVINPVTFRPPFWAKIALMIKGYAYFAWTFVNGILNPPQISEDRHPETEESVCHNARFSASLAQLKSIQKKTNGSTFSAILLTATQNALDEINKKHLALNSYVIVAKVPYPKSEFCNRITALNAIVPEKQTDVKGYLDQLEAVNKETRVPSNLTFFVNDTMNRLFGRMPATVMQALQKQVKSLLLISNLPFATRPFLFGDGVMTDCYVWPALSKSIFVSSMSLGDKINVTIGAGSNLLSKEELALVVDELKNQFNIMEQDDFHKKEN